MMIEGIYISDTNGNPFHCGPHGHTEALEVAKTMAQRDGRSSPVYVDRKATGLGWYVRAAPIGAELHCTIHLDGSVTFPSR